MFVLTQIVFFYITVFLRNSLSLNGNILLKYDMSDVNYGKGVHALGDLFFIHLEKLNT